MNEQSITTLRAEVAERDEDYRIARKHFVQAAERTGTPENQAAYKRALSWMDECKIRRERAHSALIRVSLVAS